MRRRCCAPRCPTSTRAPGAARSSSSIIGTGISTAAAWTPIALPRGYAGGRVSGNAFWLESSWRSFADYEARLNESLAGAPDVLPVRREAPESLRCPRKPLNSLPPKNMKCLSATSLLLMLLRLRLGVIRSRAQPQYNGEELLLAVEPRRVKRA